MTDTSLDRVLSFNDLLIALVKLGLPLELGIEGNRTSQIEWLRRTSADLALQAGRGSDLDRLIDDDRYPSTYQRALTTWLKCDQPTIVLDALLQPANVRRRVGTEVGRALFQPLIVFVLTYVGFVFFCLYLFPRIEGVYAQLWQEPSPIIACFRSVQAAMPVWVPLVPVLTIAAVIIWMIRSPRQSWRWLPGSRRYFQLVGNARFADQVADLVQHGADPGGAVSLAGAVNDTGPQMATSPMLHWVLENESGAQAPPVLRFVAKLYRTLARRHSFVWRIVLPTLFGVLIGGVLVLGYGVALFLPLTQLMHDLALAGGG